MLKHITETRNEEKELVKEQSFPVARHYVDKVLGRLDRILEGESIGSMIESELENLQIDDDFEMMRHRIEVPSEVSSEKSEPTLDLKSVESFENEKQEFIRQVLERQAEEEERMQSEKPISIRLPKDTTSRASKEE